MSMTMPATEFQDALLAKVTEFSSHKSFAADSCEIAATAVNPPVLPYNPDVVIPDFTLGDPLYAWVDKEMWQYFGITWHGLEINTRRTFLRYYPARNITKDFRIEKFGF